MTGETGDGSVISVMFFDFAEGRRPSVPIESFGRSRLAGVGAGRVGEEGPEPVDMVLAALVVELVLAPIPGFKLELALGLGPGLILGEAILFILLFSLQIYDNSRKREWGARNT